MSFTCPDSGKLKRFPAIIIFSPRLAFNVHGGFLSFLLEKLFKSNRLELNLISLLRNSYAVFASRRLSAQSMAYAYSFAAKNLIKTEA